MNSKGSVGLVATLIALGIILAGGGMWYLLAKPANVPNLSEPNISNSTSSVETQQQSVANETTTAAEEQPVSKHPWPEFHGNYFHTGYTNVQGPQKADLKWKFQLGKLEGGDPNSVVVSSDGIIYVAGAQEIFALDKNGKEIWSKNYQSTQGPALAEDGPIYFLSKDQIVALDQNG